KAGRSYIGFDILGDTSGFYFTASDGESETVVGESVPLSSNLFLDVFSPFAARRVLKKDGQTVVDFSSLYNVEGFERFQVTEPGSYRVEVYLDQLGPPFDKMPWIISNPIYVR
ncbi:MAG: hypothetical protein AAB288_10080, partial [Acidobacteriota bacterium]